MHDETPAPEYGILWAMKTGRGARPQRRQREKGVDLMRPRMMSLLVAVTAGVTSWAAMPAPAAYWTFDSDSITDTTVADVVGTGDGTIVGAGVGNPAGVEGQALAFPGTDGDYVDFGDVLDPGVDSYTVSFWFNAADTDGTQFMVGKGNRGSSNVGWSVWLDSVNVQTRGKETLGGNESKYGQRGPEVAAATWYHVAFVIDREQGTWRGYLDGTNEGWVTGGGGGQVDELVTVDIGIDAPESLLVGRRATTGAPFSGLVDDLAVWTAALTPGQIAAIARGLSPIPDPADATPPGAPTGLTAVAGDSAITLDWDDNPEFDLADYNVARSETSGGPYDPIAEGVVPSEYTDGTVTVGTTYYYVVTASDVNDNESDPSGEATATAVDLTAPAPPTGLVAFGFDGEVILYWDDNTEPDLAAYNVMRSETQGGPYATVAEGVGDSSWPDGTVVNGTTYYYVVTAVDVNTNESDPSAEVEVVAGTPELPTPVAYWTFNTDDIEGTIVRDREETQPFDGTIVGENVTNPAGRLAQALAFPGADTDYVDFGNVLDPGTESFTVALWFKAEAVTAPTFIAGKGNAGSRDVGWGIWMENGNLYVRGQQVGGDDSARFGQNVGPIETDTWYHVVMVLDREQDVIRGYLDGWGDWNTGGGGGQTDTLIPDSEVSSPESLFVGRRSSVGAPFAGLIDEVAVWRTVLTLNQIKALARGTPPIPEPGDTTPPATPAGFTGFAEDSRVVLQWDDNTEDDLLGYNLYRAETAGGPYDTVAERLAESEYIDTGVVNDTTYYYEVTALDTSNNESDPSEELAFTPLEGLDQTPPAPPTGLIAVGLDGEVRLAWADNAEPDLAGYAVRRSETAGGPYTAIATDVTASELTDTDVENGTAYYYVVTAVDTSDNESDPGQEASATPDVFTMPAPAAYWTCDTADISDVTLFDIVGTSDGTIVGDSVTNPAGAFDEALGFPGLDTDHVDFGLVLDPGTDSYTVSLWFRATALDGVQFLIAKGNAASSGEGWSMWLDGSTIHVRGQQLGATNDDRFGQNKAGAVTAQRWHHVVMVLDREADTVRGYLDASNDGWVAGGGGSQVDTLLPDSDITAAAQPLLAARRATDGAPLNGLIDDIAIWNAALTPHQIAALTLGVPPAVVELEPTFKRGDANRDGSMNIADAIYILQNLFAQGPPLYCLEAADGNDDDSVNIADAVYILQNLFAQGPAIPPPHEECGPDTTLVEDGVDLGCEDYCAEACDPPPGFQGCPPPLR